MCICILALRGNLTACDRPSIQCAVSCWARGLLPGLLCHSGLQSYGSLAPRRGHRGFEHESLNTSACGLRSPTHVNITQLSELHWYTWMCHVPGRSRESLPGPRTGLRWGPRERKRVVEKCELALERSWKQAEASTPTSVSSGAQAAAGESHTSGTAQARGSLDSDMPLFCEMLAGLPIRQPGMGGFAELQGRVKPVILPTLSVLCHLCRWRRWRCLNPATNTSARR